MEEKKQAPINITDVFKKLWPHKKLYFKVLPATLILTYLFTLFVPRYYNSSVSIAPEPTGASSLSGSLGSLGSLASSMGLSSLSKMGNSDAINVDIYPDVLTSYDFIAELMPVQVKSQDGGINTNYYTYLRDHQRYAWWTQLMGMMHELFEPAQETPTYSGDQKLSVFNLNRKQQYIFMEARSKITCKIDKKTGIVTIMVKDLDPLIAATMAKATCKKLQEFITNYRTNKAKIDYEYYKKLTADAKADYEKVRRKYGATSDANTDVTMKSMELLLTDLENDMQLKYNIYTAMSAQMQSSEAKLQEATPAFTIIESPSIPFKPAGPRRLVISVAMMILSFFVLTGKLLLKKTV